MITLQPRLKTVYLVRLPSSALATGSQDNHLHGYSAAMMTMTQRISFQLSVLRALLYQWTLSEAAFDPRRGELLHPPYQSQLSYSYCLAHNQGAARLAGFQYLVGHQQALSAYLEMPERPRNSHRY